MEEYGFHLARKYLCKNYSTVSKTRYDHVEEINERIPWYVISAVGYAQPSRSSSRPHVFAGNVFADMLLYSCCRKAACSYLLPIDEMS